MFLSIAIEVSNTVPSLDLVSNGEGYLQLEPQMRAQLGTCLFRRLPVDCSTGVALELLRFQRVWKILPMLQTTPAMRCAGEENPSNCV